MKSRPEAQGSRGGINAKHKMRPLPTGSKVRKTPLAHRISRHPERTIYVSTGAPFMSLVKRVRKRLDRDYAGQRTGTKGLPFLARMQALQVGKGRANKPAGGKGVVDVGVDLASLTGGNTDENEVLLLATGRAMEKAVEVAAFFMRQGDCEIALRSGSVDVVDEVEYPEGKMIETIAAPARDRDSKSDDENEGGDMEMEGQGQGQEQDNEEEEDGDTFRMRMLTYVEIGVKLRTK